MPGEIELECHKRRQCHKRRNLRNRFEIVKTLGQGTYGKVKLAIERESGEPFAIKSIKKKQIGTEQDLQRLRREIEIMTHLNHPHIISVYEVFENSDKIILVMEYASGGELYDYCNDKQGLYDDEARKFFRQIISAVHYLHTNGIVHRDLKLENIVLDYNGDCKIADFGFANICRHDRLLSTFCGSPLYASPEIVNGLPYHGPEVDCWSLGVLLYAMVYGAMPFDGSDFRRLRNQITAGEYFTPNRPSDAEDLIAKLLCPNAHKRATIADISSHWWVNLGYHYNPVDDTLPGKVVDQKSLSTKLFSSSPAENDCNDNKTGNQLINGTKSNPSQSSRDNTSSPIKGILKIPKQPLQMGCDASREPRMWRSRSLDANINLVANWPMPSQRQEASMHNTNMAFDSSRMPKKSILKKQHSQPSDECGANYVTEHSTLDNDLIAYPVYQCTANKDVCDEHPLGQLTSVSDSDSADIPVEEHLLSCYDLGDIEAVLDGLTDNEVFSESVTLPPVKSCPLAEDSGIVGDISSMETSPTFPQELGDVTVLNNTPHELADDDGVVSEPSNTQESSLKGRKKGILKNKQNNATWRCSISSQDSSSSTDILNFSYDSAEGDNLLSEYFSMPLTLPMVSDDSVALEMAPMPNQLMEGDEEALGPPPPLPSCPPPSSNGGTSYEDNFPCKNDEIIEKILQLGNQDAVEQSKDMLSPRVIDWCEVEDIYRKALELHSEWS